MNASGYGSFGYKRSSVLAHRFAWVLSGHSIPAGAHVLHRCDNRLCVNVAHLYLGTNSDNVADMMARGRHRPGAYTPRAHAVGARNGKAKLSEAAVREIRRRYAEGGITHSALAAEYGIAAQGIARIVRGELWTHVS